MAFDLEEQEQIESLKAFWQKWGTLITSIVVVSILTVLGWKGYEAYQVKQSQKASLAYDAYVMALQKKDANAPTQLTELQASYAKSRYAALASLNAAQAAIAEQQWDKAQAPLQWLISNGTVENQAVARLMLADVLAQMTKNDEALKTLDTVPASQFAAAFASKKADVYLLMNDNAKARESMEAALKAVQAQSVKDENLERIVKSKLELLPS